MSNDMQSTFSDDHDLDAVRAFRREAVVVDEARVSRSRRRLAERPEAHRPLRGRRRHTAVARAAAIGVAAAVAALAVLAWPTGSAPETTPAGAPSAPADAPTTLSTGPITVSSPPWLNRSGSRWTP